MSDQASPEGWNLLGQTQDGGELYSRPVQRDVLPRYEAEVTFWSDDSPPLPLLKVSAKGSAKAVARMVEAAADAFTEDAER
jgi:hypothetical protein